MRLSLNMEVEVDEEVRDAIEKRISGAVESGEQPKDDKEDIGEAAKETDIDNGEAEKETDDDAEPKEDETTVNKKKTNYKY